MEFRTLKPSEIDCRVSQISEKGLTLLLYKDARVDMAVLDETVGPEYWQRNHEVVNGNLFCNVGIKIRHPGSDYAEWVWKQDVGTESNTEAEKGQASDSFKRACVNWGIGRELYTAPFIWIKAKDCTIKERGADRNGKVRYACYDEFVVTKIAYNDAREISSLEIVNKSTGNVCFTYGAAARGEKPKEEKPEQAICADCGQPITDVTWPNGQRTSATKMAQETFKKFGKCLCGTCYTGLAVNDGSQG